MDDLARRIRMESKLPGNFTLRSGRASETYFDKYGFEAEPTLLLAIAKKLACSIADYRSQLGVGYSNVNEEPVNGRPRRTRNISGTRRQTYCSGTPRDGSTFHAGDFSAYARRPCTP